MPRRFWLTYALVLVVALPTGTTLIWNSFAVARTPTFSSGELPGTGFEVLTDTSASGPEAAEEPAPDGYEATDVPPTLRSDPSSGPSTTTGPAPLTAKLALAAASPALMLRSIPGANYPSSPLITRVTWGRAMRRKGCGDNLPVTWAADGHLYTAFGDCTGFGRRTASTTVARLSNDADPIQFLGRNVWQLDGGGGPAGKKISGLISIHGVLYGLFRNADGDGHRFQVGLSRDGGAHWRLASWTLPWGYPTFVNYGRDNRGAPDGNVYVVSPDTSSAYAPSTDPAHRGMILMRVPAGRLLDRSAYAYFKGFWRERAHWSLSAAVRKLAFTCSQTACLRGQISYDAPLGRYLWWQQNFLTTPDTRWRGGFALYEAPNLWGPWRTVFFTRNAVTDPGFHDGPGDGGSFPTKWISRDGRTLYLVCSCQNTLTVRRVVLATG